MSNRNACSIDLISGLKKVNNILNKEFKGDASKQVLLQHVKDELANVTKQVEADAVQKYRDGIDDESLGELKQFQKRQILDIFNTYRVADENNTLLDSILKGVADKSGTRGAITTFFQRTDTLLSSSDTWFDNMVENVMKTLDTGGVRFNAKTGFRAVDMLQDTLAGGTKLHKFLQKMGQEDPQKAIFMALREGSSKIPELDTLARAYKTIDDFNMSKIKSDAPYMGDVKNHVVPLRINRDKISFKGYAEFEKFMLDSVDTSRLKKKYKTTEDLQQAIRMTYDKIDSDTSFAPNNKFRSTTNPFSSRKFHFKSAELEWEFNKQFGEGTENILASSLQHKRRLLRSTVLHEIHGPNVSFNLQALSRHIESKGLLSEGEIKAQITKHSNALESKMGIGEETGRVYSDIITGLQNIVTYGLTGSSMLRDLAFDKTIYTGMVSALYKDNSHLLEITKQTWGLLKTAVTKGEIERAGKILENQGIMTQMSNAQLYSSQMGNANKLNKIVANTKSEAIAKRFKDVTGKGKEFVSWITLANRVQKAGRVSQAFNAGNIMMESLGRKLNDATTAVQRQFQQAGIGELEFEALKKVKKLEYKGSDRMLDIHEFKNLDQKTIDSFKRNLESNDDAIRRLRYSYQLMTNELINALSTVPSKRGAMIPDQIPGHPHINDLLKFSFRFSNIAFSQWFNIQRALRSASGLNPGKAGNRGMSYVEILKNNPQAFAKVLTGTITGGLFVLWLQDLKNNKTPRSISPETVLDALTASGAGGLASFVASNMKYGDDVIGTPLNAIIKPALSTGKALVSGKGDVALRHTGRAAKVLLPTANMWLTSAAWDAGWRNVTGDKETSAQKRRMKERNQKHLID